MQRNYVIVCNEHKSTLPITLLFWGEHTEDSAKRSYSGYTCQIDKCERYTHKELESWRGEFKIQYPFFEEIKQGDFYKHDEVLITIEQLKEFGFREFHVLSR